MEQSPTTAWYKQFWPWFLIALPAAVVVASIVTIFIAVQNPDSIVIDDYYKAGLAINRDLSREQQAEKFNIKASLRIDAGNSTAIVTVDAGEQARPAQLHMQLTHPTLPDMDQSVILTRQGNYYSGTIKPVIAGAWNLSLESTAPAWRIQRRIVIDSTTDLYRLR